MVARGTFSNGKLLLLGLVVVPVVAGLAIAPAAASHPGTSAVHRQGPTKGVMQDYLCSTPIGDAVETVAVSAKASATGSRLLLKNVKYVFINNFGIDINVTDLRFSVPDPDKANAPYEKGSAAVGDKPPGWKAGHKAGAIFESFADDMDVAADAVIPVAPLSAAYKSSGPKGTVVKWKAGAFSFFVTDGGPVDCQPMAPFRTIASVTE